jgi:hypothetical protein
MIIRSAYGAVTLALALVLLLSLQKQAHAYVDPGSGLLAYQSLMATFAGVLFYIRRRLKLRIGKDPQPRIDPAND